MFKKLSLLMFVSVFVVQINASSELADPVAVRSASPVAVRPASPVASVRSLEAGALAGAGAGAGFLRRIIANSASDVKIADLEALVKTRDSEIARLLALVKTRDSEIAIRDGIIETNKREIDYYKTQEGSFRALRTERDQALLRAAEAESLAAKFTV